MPTDFGLEYQDLPLATEDGITLRCYLLMQRTEISHSHAPRIEYADHETDEEVRILCASEAIHPPLIYLASLHPRDLRS